MLQPLVMRASPKAIVSQRISGYTTRQSRFQGISLGHFEGIERGSPASASTNSGCHGKGYTLDFWETDSDRYSYFLHRRRAHETANQAGCQRHRQRHVALKPGEHKIRANYSGGGEFDYYSSSSRNLIWTIAPEGRNKPVTADQPVPME
jgi:hypothetical protein